ncbi:hypothetical protein MHJ94_08375 [Chryseobacterium taklimakanense]|nr:hypothetical protein [Chryseobacterium taklimakanense]MCG7281309.1 hypothetical protein [Chryseobacterium taklimakanense]
MNLTKGKQQNFHTIGVKVNFSSEMNRRNFGLKSKNPSRNFGRVLLLF